MCSYCAHSTRSNPFIFCSQQSSTLLSVLFATRISHEILADNKTSHRECGRPTLRCRLGASGFDAVFACLCASSF